MNHLTLYGFDNGDYITVKVKPDDAYERYFNFRNRLPVGKFKRNWINKNQNLHGQRLKDRILRHADRVWSRKDEFEFFGLSSLSKNRNPNECYQNSYGILFVEKNLIHIIVWYDGKMYQISAEKRSTNPIFYAEIPLK